MTSLVLILALFITAAAGPVSHFGMLKACKVGNKGQLCGEKTGNSTPILLKGPSLYWSDGTGAPFYTVETVDWFVDNMQIGVIRAAMAIRYYGNNTEDVNKPGGVPGYYFDANRQKNLIRNIVDAAIINDIYVIIDWHSHNAHQNTEPTLAREFFSEMAREYKDVPNIIWEVYNEPINASVSDISTYANNIVSAIRSAGSQHLVLIGSPSYSKQPQQQAQNWGSSKDANVAFTFHFYAGTHPFPSGDGIGTSAQGAIGAGYSIFGSEWGTVNADGNGSVNTSASNSWTNWMDENKVSNCMWNASSLSEGSAMFTTGTGTGNLSTSRLTTNGQYFQTYMGKNKWTAQIPSTHPKGNDVSASVKDGSAVTISSLGLTGTITAVSQPDFGSAEFTGNSITYTTSPSGSPSEKVRFTYKITQGSVTVQRRVTVAITERRPILPQKNPLAVSRKAPTMLSMANHLSPSDPSGTKLSIKEVSLSNPSLGTVAITSGKDTVIFTPNASLQNAEPAEVTLNYTIQNTAGLYSSAGIVLQIQNLVPIINTNNICCLGSKPNTAPIGIGMGGVGAQDRDKDSIWFATDLYLHPQYPGHLEKIKADSFVYFPEANKTGKIVILAVATDGSLNSVLGKTNLTLTGSGTDIGNLTPPTEIPGWVSPITSKPYTGGHLSITYFNQNIELNFAQSGFAKLDIYSLSGKNITTLLNGYQNAGSHNIPLNINLQKGVYILRLKQGSQVKTLRIIK